MNWVTVALLPLFAIGIWLYTALVSAGFPTLKGKRIVLLIAHPDDEAMFFAPTLLSLTRPELGNHVKILCMSTGNAEGLGETRKKELQKSGLLLGLRGEEDVLVVDDPNFPDSMTTTWHPRLLSNFLTATFAPKMSSISSKSAPEASIDAIITFDNIGVSSHPNHISLFNGAQSFIKALMHRHSGWECPVKLYTLTSTNIVRKYLSILDAPLTLMSAVTTRKEAGQFPTPMINVSMFGGYGAARKAMTAAHVSQMVWFRWGWISVGRYMVVNDLKKLKTLLGQWPYLAPEQLRLNERLETARYARKVDDTIESHSSSQRANTEQRTSDRHASSSSPKSQLTTMHLDHKYTFAVPYFRCQHTDKCSERVLYPQISSTTMPPHNPIPSHNASSPYPSSPSQDDQSQAAPSAQSLHTPSSSQEREMFTFAQVITDSLFDAMAPRTSTPSAHKHTGHRPQTQNPNVLDLSFAPSSAIPSMAEIWMTPAGEHAFGAWGLDLLARLEAVWEQDRDE